MKLPHLYFLVIFIIFSTGKVYPADLNSLIPNFNRFKNIRSESKLQKQLQEIIQVGISKAFGRPAQLPKDLDPLFQKPLAVFVTAKKSGEVRGCMGSLKPKQASLAEEIVGNLRKAFLQDPRHRPIYEDEIEGMEFFITAVGKPKRVERIESLNPMRDAILVRHGNKEGVVLPGEAKTLRYLLAFAKAKAGIKKGEVFQVYRIPTATVSIKLSQ